MSLARIPLNRSPIRPVISERESEASSLSVSGTGTWLEPDPETGVLPPGRVPRLEDSADEVLLLFAEDVDPSETSSVRVLWLNGFSAKNDGMS